MLLYGHKGDASYLENLFPAYEAGKEADREQVDESLESVLQSLNDAYSSGHFTLSQYLLVTDMLKKVTENLTARYGQVRKELDTIMGGKILEFKGEKLINQGRAEGRMEGKAEGRVEGRAELLIELVHNGMLPLETAETMAEKYGITRADFQAMVKKYTPREERMQG